MQHAVKSLEHIDGANCETLSNDFVKRFSGYIDELNSRRFEIGLGSVKNARNIVEHSLKVKLILSGYIFDMQQAFESIIIGLCP